MISRREAESIGPKIREEMRPDRAASGKRQPLPGGSPFEQLLEASFEKVQGEGKGPVNGLMAPLSPVFSPPAVEGTEEARFRESLEVVLAHEGSAYVQRDGGSESSRFGILQSTARHYGYGGDIRDLTREGAEAIYRKIWDRSGAASLPSPLSVVHFDTYVNSPAAARKLLEKSGGDAEVYLGMRAKRYRRLAALRPQRYGRYLKGWLNRIASLRELTASRAALHSPGQAVPKSLAAAETARDGASGDGTA
ncbi:MAG: glycosyl hydrolase 108 family protein [Thermodesulfovibrionales bacterium]